MPRRLLFGFALCTLGCSLGAEPGATPSVMPVPQNYREWVYLSSGIDMTYTAEDAAALPPKHDGEFDNVFVNDDAYRTFKQSGLWPDHTVFVLENRAARPNVSINKSGRTQDAEIAGIELHVKSNHQWVFYARNADGKEHLIAKPASCYTCHEAHAAVDTTFVQFYPTLLPIAQAKHVLSHNYTAESATHAVK